MDAACADISQTCLVRLEAELHVGATFEPFELHVLGMIFHSRARLMLSLEPVDAFMKACRVCRDCARASGEVQCMCVSIWVVSRDT